MAYLNDTDIPKNDDSRFIEDMLDYKQDIINALEDPSHNQDRLFKNDDRSRNAMIMSAMLDTCHEIIMYCGKMSVFRSNFYKEIDNTSQGAGERAKEEVKKSLDSFFDNKHKLTIILENFERNYLDDLISERLNDTSLVTIKRIDKDRLLTSVLSHTALGKKGNEVVIKRRETNTSKYYARCMVNLNQEMSQDALTLMSYIEEASFPIHR